METIFKNNTLKVKEINIEESNPFWVGDLYKYYEDIVEEIVCCGNIFVPKENRRKGIGSKMIQDFISENISDDKLYLFITGISIYEYTEEEFENFTPEQWKDIRSIQKEFYNKNGFININDIMHIYETKEVYLYLNLAGIRILENIHKDI